MSEIAKKVCIVTVTYGDRSRFLKQLLSYSQSKNCITDIVINDNASKPSVSKWIDKTAYSNVHILTQNENKGSAFGYHNALEYAIKHTNADFFWLLDDDNVPDEKALTNLLKYWDIFSEDNSLKALYCLRPDRKTHQEILRGANPSDYYLVSNNFMGFHIGRILKNQLRKLSKLEAEPLEYAKMPYVPYGGFFLHREGIKRIGFPDEKFFLYVDDSEYTYRITKAGGSIYMISSAIVNDVDTSQGINYEGGFFKSKILDLWNFRTYYQVRNRIFFYNRETIKDKWIYLLNKQLYLSALLGKALLNGQLKAYYKFKKAAGDGAKKNLNIGDSKYF